MGNFHNIKIIKIKNSTSQIRAFLENLTIAQLVKTFRAFRHIRYSLPYKPINPILSNLYYVKMDIFKFLPEVSAIYISRNYLSLKYSTIPTSEYV